MNEHGEFVWLELKPQQNFKDDKENKMLEVIQSASEFAFFVMHKNGTMRMIARVPTTEEGLFSTIAGLSAVRTEMPDLEGMAARYLALKNGKSLVPLLDPARLEKSNVYKKMWNSDRDSVMACFVCNKTEESRNEINNSIVTLENTKLAKGGRLSGRKREEYDWALKKKDGRNGYYNCSIFFAMETVGGRQDKAAVKDALSKLDNLIGIVSSNKFKQRIAKKRIKISSEERTFRQKIFGLFHPVKTIDPATFIPTKLRSKSLVLTENELAYFISLPEEHDIQTINFEMGPEPTFMHGKTEDIEDTDLDIQKDKDSDGESSDSQSSQD